MKLTVPRLEDFTDSHKPDQLLPRLCEFYIFTDKYWLKELQTQVLIYLVHYCKVGAVRFGTSSVARVHVRLPPQDILRALIVHAITYEICNAEHRNTDVEASTLADICADNRELQREVFELLRAAKGNIQNPFVGSNMVWDGQVLRKGLEIDSVIWSRETSLVIVKTPKFRGSPVFKKRR